jgi:hypothetical protein
MRDPIWWVACSICGTQLVNKISESGIAGACSECRDSIIPKHISLVHHPMYVRLYIKEKM